MKGNMQQGYYFVSEWNELGVKVVHLVGSVKVKDFLFSTLSSISTVVFKILSKQTPNRFDLCAAKVCFCSLQWLKEGKKTIARC